MAKVTINGEVFEWDSSHRPMDEALALEEAMKDRFPNYTAWQQALKAGSMAAEVGMVWLVWRRAGREVPIEDIFSGKAEVNLNDYKYEWAKGELEDPTNPPPAASDTTGGDTSEPSPKSSASAPGRQNSSPKRSSKT